METDTLQMLQEIKKHLNTLNIYKKKLLLLKHAHAIERLDAKNKVVKARLMRQEMMKLYRSYVIEIVKSLVMKKDLLKVQRDGKYFLCVNPSIMAKCNRKCTRFTKYGRIQQLLQIYSTFCKPY